MSENTDSSEDKVNKLYELGLNLVPTLEDKTESEFDSIKKAVEKTGAKVTASSNPEMIPLAYIMSKTVDSKKQKYNTAAFGWIKFNADTDIITSIKEALDLNTNILRYVVLKTTEEANSDAKAVAKALEDNPEKDEEKEEKKKEKAESEEKEEVEESADEAEEKAEESDSEKKDEVDEAIEDLVEETK